MRKTVGIPSSHMNQVFAHQQKDQWCWSASISMIMNAYGINISQFLLARNLCGIDQYGRACNCPATYWDIDQSLNMTGTDQNGNYFEVNAPTRYGHPDVIELRHY